MLKKIQEVKSERFIVTIFIDNDGRLTIQIGSEDGSGIVRADMNICGPVLKQKISSGNLEKLIEEER